MWPLVGVDFAQTRIGSSLPRCRPASATAPVVHCRWAANGGPIGGGGASRASLRARGGSHAEEQCPGTIGASRRPPNCVSGRRRKTSTSRPLREACNPCCSACARCCVGGSVFPLVGPFLTHPVHASRQCPTVVTTAAAMRVSARVCVRARSLVAADWHRQWRLPAWAWRRPGPLPSEGAWRRLGRGVARGPNGTPAGDGTPTGDAGPPACCPLARDAAVARDAAAARAGTDRAGGAAFPPLPPR